MQVIPAIDIKNGKCVRLYQGDYDKETIYSNDPIEMALNWKNQGAKMIHMVDLDGAREGKPKITEIIKQIIKKVQIPLEVGGGIRNVQSIKRLYMLGVHKIVVGTIALENIDRMNKIIELYGDRIIVALDVNDGTLMKKGWLQKTDLNLVQSIKRLEKIGVYTIIVTDISRDGTLIEPDYERIEIARKKIKMKLIIAGGISSIKQLKKLNKMKIDGVIIGKALYEGKINLKEAIEYVG